MNNESWGEETFSNIISLKTEMRECGISSNGSSGSSKEKGLGRQSPCGEAPEDLSGSPICTVYPLLQLPVWIYWGGAEAYCERAEASLSPAAPQCHQWVDWVPCMETDPKITDKPSAQSWALRNPSDHLVCFQQKHLLDKIFHANFLSVSLHLNPVFLESISYLENIFLFSCITIFYYAFHVKSKGKKCRQESSGSSKFMHLGLNHVLSLSEMDVHAS